MVFEAGKLTEASSEHWIILKSLSARIDFHFPHLCNSSCDTADPESRYLVISLHGSRKDELKIAS